MEFIVSADRPDEFFFMEMNTRLQVEHPVTELVTGVDLVEQQVRVAAGLALPFGQDDIVLNGHAVEVRTYAEDPARGFLPTGGTVLALREPHGQGIRVDSSLLEGTVVGSTYDPMLNKVIAWGPDRATALAKLDRALADQVVLGVGTNTAFLRRLITHPEVQAGRLDTGFIERHLDELTRDGVPLVALAAYALHHRDLLTGPDVWDAPMGWRPAGPAALRWRIALPGGEHADLALTGDQLVVDGAAPLTVRALHSGPDLLVTVGSTTSRWVVACAGASTHLWCEGASWSLHEEVIVLKGAAAAHDRGHPQPDAGKRHRRARQSR